MKMQESQRLCLRYNRNIKFKPENGMKVLVKGKISVYEASGSYQIYIQDMQPDGVGNLHLAYEQLKVRLEEEGLFLKFIKSDSSLR